MRWGAAASPVLHDNLVIVNASEESDSIRALDQKTGELVWERMSAKLEGSSISPMVAGNGNDAVLIVPLASEVWGLDPKTGEMLWQVDTGTTTGMCPTPIADGSTTTCFTLWRFQVNVI